MFLGSSAISHRQAWATVNNPADAIKYLIYGVIDSFALLTLVFLRKDFGERFYTPFHYALGVSILGGFGLTSIAAEEVVSSFGKRAAHATTSTGFTLPPWVIGLAFIIVGGLRLWEVRKRAWFGGKLVHSRSTGEPWAVWRKLGISHWIITIIVEPVLVLILGGVLVTVSANKVSGVYFAACAFLLFISALRQYQEQRDVMLDQVDARIEGEVKAAQFAEIEQHGKPIAKPGGLYFPMVLPRGKNDQLAFLRDWAEASRPVDDTYVRHEASPPSGYAEDEELSAG